MCQLTLAQELAKIQTRFQSVVHENKKNYIEKQVKNRRVNSKNMYVIFVEKRHAESKTSKRNCS